MIRDPATFRILLDTIASLVSEKLIPRERQVITEMIEVPAYIGTEIKTEQALVAANRELIARFEKKIQATLARVWGEDLSRAAKDDPVPRAA